MGSPPDAGPRRLRRVRTCLGDRVDAIDALAADHCDNQQRRISLLWSHCESSSDSRASRHTSASKLRQVAANGAGGWRQPPTQEGTFTLSAIRMMVPCLCVLD